VSKRRIHKIRQLTIVPAIEYVCNEENTQLPDLGGIQATLGKRTRHRRALMRMLFDYYETDRLIVCMDPGNLDLIQDFCGDRSITKLLEIQCNFTDDYLIGHARRVGLAGEQTPPETLERLLPTIRGDITFESDRLRDAEFENHLVMKQSNGPDENAGPIARFLDIAHDKALEIARTDHLYAD